MIFSVVSVNFNRFRCRFYCTHSIRTSDVQFDFCLRFEIGTQTHKENHPIGWFFFLLSQIVSACDIMILISSAYRLSGAKLVVYEKKQPKRLFFRRKRHEARSFGSERANARNDYAPAVSTSMQLPVLIRLGV